MARHWVMPEHRISVRLSRAVDVQSADLVVEVDSDDTKLGELRISRGTIDWVPRNHAHAYRLEWERFDEVMRENGVRS